LSRIKYDYALNKQIKQIITKYYNEQNNINSFKLLYGMKIISWNVNGLRAFHKKGAFDSIFELDPDIFCLQETKAHPDQLPEEVRSPAGYYSFFDHSKGRKGYSGVAIYIKKSHIPNTPHCEYGLGYPALDQEGRFLAVHLGILKSDFSSLRSDLGSEKRSDLIDLVLINTYFPNGGEDPVRLKYKLDFYDEFLNCIEKLKKQGKTVIFCGDVNTAHNEIDLARPKGNENHTGFLRIERDWIDKVISKGWIDTFRFLNPEKVQYSWWDMKTFARERNVGWRLDYFFVSENLKNNIKKAEILDNMFGSDHCPVLLEIK
jgi:exodeoxyribonuclease-3